MNLSELRSAMGEYATWFDAARLSAHDAARVLDDAPRSRRWPPR
jgi:hypothetical protein